MLSLPADPEAPIYESVRRNTILDERTVRAYRSAGESFGIAMRRINTAMAAWSEGINASVRAEPQED